MSCIALNVLVSVNNAPAGTAVLTLSNAQLLEILVVVAPSTGVSCIALCVFSQGTLTYICPLDNSTG